MAHRGGPSIAKFRERRPNGHQGFRNKATPGEWSDGCATIDGTLAIDFGRRRSSRRRLNEAGDVVSDVVCPTLLPWCRSQHLPSDGRCARNFERSRGYARSRAWRSGRVDGPMGKLTVESR